MRGPTKRGVRVTGGLAVGTVLVLLGAATVVQAHGGDPELIHACVKDNPPNQGLTLIVGPSDVCGAGFHPVDWSIQGPPGQDAVHREPPATDDNSVADTGGVGQHTSTTIAADGFGLISYYDQTNGDLKVAHCEDVTCSSTTVSTLDSTGDVGQYTSIALGEDGLGIISYYDVTNGDLKVAHCSDLPCTAATVTTQDPVPGVDQGQYTSIAISSGLALPIISYHDATNGYVKFLLCFDPQCVIVPAFAVAFDFGQDTSILTGADGLPLISYFETQTANLRVAHCLDVSCVAPPTITNVDTTGTVGPHTSMALGVDGLPVISYTDVTNANLKVAHCSNAACTVSTRATLDSIGNVGTYTSIAVGPDGFPMIAYYDATNQDAKVARCANFACSSGSTRIVMGNGNVGEYESMTVGVDGLGLIAFYGSSNGVLRVVHCPNAFCQDFLRAR